MDKRTFDSTMRKTKGGMVDKGKVKYKVQLFRDDEPICHYYLSVNGDERLPITARELNKQSRLQDWFVERRYTPMDSMALKEFELWRNELLENAILIANKSDKLQADAEHIELFTTYFGLHVPMMVRSKGEEYLSGKVGDVVRVNNADRRIYFKWGRFKAWCQRAQNIPDKKVEELRFFVEEKGEYLDKRVGKGGWWRCTHGLPMGLFNEVILEQWLDPTV